MCSRTSFKMSSMPTRNSANATSQRRLHRVQDQPLWSGSAQGRSEAIAQGSDLKLKPREAMDPLPRTCTNTNMVFVYHLWSPWAPCLSPDPTGRTNTSFRHLELVKFLQSWFRAAHPQQRHLAAFYELRYLQGSPNVHTS